MGDDVRPGDRVRVHTEYEAKVDWMDPYRYALVDDDGHDRNVSRIYRGTKVTKVEPPVEQFKPGDVVRLRGTRTTYTLGKLGYIRVSRTANPSDPEIFEYRYGVGRALGHPASPEYFTSELFEKVNI